MKRCGVILSDGIKDFHPAYFAMVMATGIMSIAFEAMAFPGIAKTLFTLNLVFYLILCAILAARAVLFLPDLMVDLRTLRRAVLFLTFVVGTNTVGIQLATFQQATEWAIGLGSIALAGWFGCLYFIVLDFIAMQGKPLHEVVNGATLLVVVSTVSISLLGVHLLDAMEIHTGYAYLMAASFWITGYILYLLIITVLIYRLFFRRFETGDWDAPYWICMGAAAIIVLAGSELVMRMPALPGWEDIRQTVLWMTVVAWSMGTLWTPYLLVMDIQKFTRVGIAASAPMWIKTLPWSRLAFGRQYYAYDPPSWSRVFPMGMYAACTISLSKAAGFGSLATIPQYWGWFALLVWSLTLIGMLRAVMNIVRISPH